MATLLIGFDSAWTRRKRGAIVGAVLRDDGAVTDVGLTQSVSYPDAADVIRSWQLMYAPSSTLVLLDQPTIVDNLTGQRPVERIVCSAISRRRGGMQPSNRGRQDMFGDDAPVWEFLNAFGGAADPFSVSGPTQVFETYPVLAMIALGWTLADAERTCGRLPKYNPGRSKTFGIDDWTHVCKATAAMLGIEGAGALASWAQEAAGNRKPTKAIQDQLDACVALSPRSTWRSNENLYS